MSELIPVAVGVVLIFGLGFLTGWTERDWRKGPRK